ncbi:GDP-mannose 4,6-dehydratase [Pseudomonas sp. JS3066]|jgi:GDP-4-dehydro-6-deoxy-D-mannose reductase|uniref:GDP-mannose 4,6-dehydratase n=1 Tax=Pseudomonas sp. JS3066 TaxID=3090665 RepID=UPI002E7B2802|nr:GDP-mannose 4,6-dehydratase [Pseudomonas sp. JS3066]WVK92844.1 GDP-mannose 4,6-dehydratase [Pseudomonas sp. JS3066]
MKRILLTGANGFVGKVLRAQLEADGQEVIAACTSAPVGAGTTDRTVRLDVRDPESIANALQISRPTHVVHLAAVSHVPTSFRDPLLTWQTNVMGSLNLLDAIKQHCPEAFVLFASSSEVYGESFKAGTPLDEGAPCSPLNPYAASKVAAETAFNEYFRQGVRGVIARPFNHIGPGQSPDFVTASFARQIAQIELGKQAPVLQVGNLEAYRDFLDVRDVCSAYLRLLELQPGTNHPRLFNIASGQARKIQEILDVLLAQSQTIISVEQDPDRLRPSDIPFAVGSIGRLHATTGWTPSHSISETLGDLLNYWRKQVAAEA